MYLDYFGLAEAPFSIAPDPRFLYLSQRHQEALAHLLYGVNGDGGFVLLTGEVGAGKTTVCRCLLQQIPASCDVAYIFNPKLTVEELLSTICVEFGIACPSGNASIKVFVDCINAYLLDAHAKGRHTVLIIDEAQNLSAEVLEQMRLLTNLETERAQAAADHPAWPARAGADAGPAGTAAAQPAHRRALSPGAADQAGSRSLCATSARDIGRAAAAVSARA